MAEKEYSIERENEIIGLPEYYIGDIMELIPTEENETT